MTESISVSTSFSNKYEIFLGEDLTDEFTSFIKRFNSEKCFFVIDEHVQAYHQKHLDGLLENHFKHVHIFTVPSGESSKSFKTYKKLLDFILQHSPERGTPLIAAGGGVTGDLTGFAAATVLRGIPLIHLPTTLLAMVDSSIGGKTGINHEVGKNLIGSFYQPEAVFSDISFLKTLPRKEWINGLSEILKYAFIHSPELLNQLKIITDKNVFEPDEAWIPIIHKCAGIKTEIIKEDVLEAGKRKFLNFGHTFAHVLEREGNYKEFSHGEAVFAGMVAAIHASNEMGALIDEKDLLQFKYLYDFTLNNVEANTAQLTELMKSDKKVVSNKVQLILLKEMGRPFVQAIEDQKMVENAWDHILMEFRK